MSLETTPHQLYKGSQEGKLKSGGNSYTAPYLSDKWRSWWFSQWQSLAHVALILFLLKFERKKKWLKRFYLSFLRKTNWKSESFSKSLKSGELIFFLQRPGAKGNGDQVPRGHTLTLSSSAMEEGATSEWRGHCLHELQGRELPWSTPTAPHAASISNKKELS